MLNLKDSCGTGFICNLKNIRSHEILRYGIEALKNLTHRGAVGADGKTGDGCGVLFEIPENFYKNYLKEKGVFIDDKLRIAVGVFFCDDKTKLVQINEAFKIFTFQEIYVRDVPINIDALGEEALKTLPYIVQVIIPYALDQDEMEQKLFIVGRYLEKNYKGINIVSLSAYNMVYKGLLIAPNILHFYPDLTNEYFVTRYCIFHQRYSTNTVPSWELVQPFNCIAHNGEINTIKANRERISAYEECIYHSFLEDYREYFSPLCNEDESDSRSLDRVFKILILSKFSADLAINLLIPPAWEGIPFIDKKIGSLLQYNELIMHPWDGPAAIIYCDGKTIGAHLDRNGLRPLRYSIYEDGIVVVGSETGLVDVKSNVIKRGKLGSGDTLSIKIDAGYIRSRMEILNELSLQKNYTKEVNDNLFVVKRESEEKKTEKPMNWQLVSFGYTEEEIKTIIPKAAKEGKEIIFSMGDDTPIPPLSENSPLLFRYFKQKFAQVTNPPIDPLREKLVMTLSTYLGTLGNLLNYDDELHKKKIFCPSPILSRKELSQIENNPLLKSKRLSTCYSNDITLKEAIENLEKKVIESVEDNYNILILSDIELKRGELYIPSLLAISASTNILKKNKLLSRASFIVETGEARDSHHIACLIGFGASCVYPYLAYNICQEESPEMFRIAMEYGLRKIISKMGISCISSYMGGKLFDAIMLKKEFLDSYFPGIDSSIECDDLHHIENNYKFYANKAVIEPAQIIVGGDMKFKKDGEWHAWSPQLLRALKNFLKTQNYNDYLEYARVAEDARPVFLRHLLELPKKEPISLDDVESEESILKRFVMGGMSLGALSPEAHETIVSACNELGIKSNTGEGGENPNYHFTEKGAQIKQVASGRFGVTPIYLASAKEIEIKIAQGAKPGEGGQLPGSKVNEYIAFLRHSQPGITLISPPPHHDIYSIEDLAQLINDLKNANPFAKICVKLVSEIGIGQIASGVVKAYADIIHISSVDGGTGASPYVSIKNAGNYWEIGLSEVHRTLCFNNLRKRVTLRVDGGFKTGKDIIIAAFLGAEEFGFGTLMMLAEGCIMARQCHLNTCPTGIATQNDELRKRFHGSKEDIKTFFLAIARQVREILAGLGYRSFNDIIGKAHLLKKRSWSDFQKTERIDIKPIISEYSEKTAVHSEGIINKPLGNELNDRIYEELKATIEKGEEIFKTYKISNINRSVPIKLSYAISMAKKNGISIKPVNLFFEGTAGQSFGAFNQDGMLLFLKGEANDYVGKGMNGGRIIIISKDNLVNHKNYLAGNTVLYGATGGELFIAGRVGERFAVRNSGAKAVIEGAGHHLCEYMTGGIVVVLGGVGLNIGAGMTGGKLFIFDEMNNIDKRINSEYVEIVDCNKEDVKLIENFLQKHYFYTKSDRAGYLLENLNSICGKFKVILPK